MEIEGRLAARGPRTDKIKRMDPRFPDSARSAFSPKANLAVLVVWVHLSSVSDAWAYIDPGTGSYLFQLLIAGGLAGLYTARKWFKLTRVLLSKVRRRASVPTQPNAVE